MKITFSKRFDRLSTLLKWQLLLFQYDSHVHNSTKRASWDFYAMIKCGTGCNPLVYKGYGCYCGFLGSGNTVDPIDTWELLVPFSDSNWLDTHSWCILYESKSFSSGLIDIDKHQRHLHTRIRGVKKNGAVKVWRTVLCSALFYTLQRVPVFNFCA